MNTDIKEIIDFLVDLSGTRNIDPDSDIFKDIGITGDDFHEMIEKFGKKFSVNMNSYLGYFHADEEGLNIGGLFFAPPHKRVTRIPITPKILTEFAKIGKWGINYPNHKLPRKRIDLIINNILFGIVIITILISIIIKVIE
jgi:hypothetical protein